MSDLPPPEAAHPANECEDDVQEEVSYEHCIRISRREFYGVLAAITVGGSAFTLKKTIEDPHAIIPENFMERLAKKAVESQGSEIMTIGQAVLFSITQELLARGLDAANISHGACAYTDEHWDSENLDTLRHMLQKNALNPLVEESIFRLVPAALTNDDDMSWPTGLSINALFGVLHNFDRDAEGHWLFHYTSLPILQFILGNYCWYLMKTKGFSHAVAAHITSNYCLMNALPALYRKQEKENE